MHTLLYLCQKIDAIAYLSKGRVMIPWPLRLSIPKRGGSNLLNTLSIPGIGGRDEDCVSKIHFLCMLNGVSEWRGRGEGREGGGGGRGRSSSGKEWVWNFDIFAWDRWKAEPPVIRIQGGGGEGGRGEGTHDTVDTHFERLNWQWTPHCQKIVSKCKSTVSGLLYVWKLVNRKKIPHSFASYPITILL
jgi:hypothetical protein